MHRSEAELAARCFGCGAEVQGVSDRAFSFGTRGVLCFDCALARGGRYDEGRDGWVDEPNLDGIENAWD
jgi:hypothetical protein